MATPRKKASTEATTVTRITASDSGDKTPRVPKNKQVSKAVSADRSTKRRNPFVAFKDYFVGAWYELRQVRWPNRRATWGMTGALLAFTAFFIVVILLLDSLFKFIFQTLVG